MKIFPLGDELSNADRQTDMTNLIVALRSFANAPKKKKKLIANCHWIRKKLNDEYKTQISGKDILPILN